MTTSFPSPQSRHRRLSEQVQESVRHDIVRGAFPANTRLSEFELSEQLGVSRTPVREALIKLAEEGLVRIVPQVGTFVAPISVASVKEAQFIREHLECGVIADAANRIDEKSLRHLNDNLDRQTRAAEERDWESFYSLDEALHETLAAVSGHFGTWRMIQQSKGQLDRVRHLSFRLPDHMTRLIDQHRTIVDALGRRDAAAAQSALRFHLREVLGTLDKLGLGEDPAAEPSGRKTTRPQSR